MAGSLSLSRSLSLSERIERGPSGLVLSSGEEGDEVEAGESSAPEGANFLDARAIKLHTATVRILSVEGKGLDVWKGRR